MAISHTFSYGVSVNAGAPTQFSSYYSFDGQTNLSVSLPSTSGTVVLCNIPSGKLNSIAMWTDGVATVSLLPNVGSGTAVASWSFNSGMPVMWQTGYPTNTPVSGAGQSLVCSNVAVSGTLLTGYIGYDA